MARRAGALLSVGITAIAMVGATAGASAGKHVTKVAVAAAPVDVAANGSSTTRITVHVRNGIHPVRTTVALSLSSATSGACGSLGASSGRTNAGGTFATTYRSSSVSGFCTVAASAGQVNGSVIVDQTSPTVSSKNEIALGAKSTSLAPGATTTLTVSVSNGGSAVVGDVVDLTASPLEPGACGVLTQQAAATDANGIVTATYQSPSGKGGVCRLRAGEAQSGAKSNVVAIHEGGPPIV
jgi:hypothetical protein